MNKQANKIAKKVLNLITSKKDEFISQVQKAEARNNPGEEYIIPVEIDGVIDHVVWDKIEKRFSKIILMFADGKIDLPSLWENKSGYCDKTKTIEYNIPKSFAI